MQWFRGITLCLAAGLMLSQAFRASALDLSSISGPAIVEQVPTRLTQQEETHRTAFWSCLHAFCSSMRSGRHLEIYSKGAGAEVPLLRTRVCVQLLHLATFSDDPLPAVTRLIFTPNDMKARQ